MAQSNIMADEYGILQVIPCHKADIRAVSGYPEGGVLTGSRDNTAKLFKPEEPSKLHSELSEVQKFTTPTHFVSSICYGRTRAGVTEIYVGSHDCNIYVYIMERDEPVDIMMGHSGPVSALAFRVCGEEDLVISGGWDSMARIWENHTARCYLAGHTNPVWDIAFVARSCILTAGADKTIRRWNIPDGQLLNVYQDHTDCVRGLAVVNSVFFLSCSNDQTVKLWTMDGEVIRTFKGHENFIYDICIVRDPIPKGVEPPKTRPYKFVTVSEDKTVRVWDKDMGCVQKIPLQATTLWSVAGLDNGNFVVGSSDGHAYIFSKVLPDLAEEPEKESSNKEVQEPNK